MKKVKESITKYWYLYIVAILLGMQVLVFAIFGGDSYIQVHDNLDLFIPHYKMLSLENAWFSQDVQMPMLHGIDRNLLGSEFLLYNILYIVFPSLWAYFIGYALKIAIGLFAFNFLAKDIFGDKYKEYKKVVILIALAYGMIPVFPTYGIAFTSIPLIVVLVRRLYIQKTFRELKADGVDKSLIIRRILLYAGVFCYPILSYFSYHGFFILGYMCVALIILWVKDKKFPTSIFASICTLSCGYVLFEYRLFKAMLFDDTVTIRTTMLRADSSLIEALKAGAGEFCNASFHSQDSHTYLILVIVLIAIVAINYLYIKNKQGKKILTDPINLIMLWIIFNCLIFGLCDFVPFRTLLETLLPPLKGFEFSRTSFFNPFLWYAELLLVTIRMINSGKKLPRVAAAAIALFAALIVMFVPQLYNDFYSTCYNQAYKIIKKKDTSTLNYNEFFSEDLFEEIKSDIEYNGQWSVAYGMHPGILVYNGISTLDGYLGMYSQEYKEKWMSLEAPAFEGSPSMKSYYEDWGARVCLYSGSDENTYAPVRELELNDLRLMVNMDVLKELECSYIFSRVEFDNSDELGIKLIGSYSGHNSPYTIYVYGIK